MFRYVHTNIIAKDPQRLINFYKNVFQCKSIAETRDLRGEWLDRLTWISNAHIVGEHLCLPGYEKDHPTLEIFSYDTIENSCSAVNKAGIAHLAFEADDVTSKRWKSNRRIGKNGIWRWEMTNTWCDR